MGEMDIYMRRRLVALGGLVAFFIFFVLLVRSCGGDDGEAPLTPVGGTTGENGATALSESEFISQADQICEAANSAVGALDPTDPDATRRELQITRQELQQLQSLEVEQESRLLRQFMQELNNVVEALESKQAAIQRGDTVTEGEAQAELDTAEANARELGERYGFRDCGQFLDAGEAPGGEAPETEGEVVPGETDEPVPPADDGAVAPPADDGTVAPPADDGTAPPPDDSGGITP